MKKLFCCIVLTILFFSFAFPVFAHEAYVLPETEFEKGLSIITPNPLAPLFSPLYWQMSVSLILALLTAYVCVVFWSVTKQAEKCDRFVKKAVPVSLMIIRLTLGIALFSGALEYVAFGPELSLTHMPAGNVVQILLILISFYVLLGLWVQVATVLGLAVFLYVMIFHGSYMLTYTHYAGTFLLLLISPSSRLSLDTVLQNTYRFLKNYQRFAVPIFRIFFGFALVYASFTIKFLHQDLPILVYNMYNLQQFFHAPASYVAAGAGVIEMIIGISILLGFAMRFTLINVLIFMTLSLFYFRELVWPHLLLYGSAIYLFINSADAYTMDRYMREFWVKGVRRVNRVMCYYM